MSPMRSWPKSAWVFIACHSGAGWPGPGVPVTSFHEGASTLAQGPERLVRGNRGAQLVVVVRALGLGRLLHLEEISVVDLAAVGADRALAEERVVRGQLLHLLDHLDAG